MDITQMTPWLAAAAVAAVSLAPNMGTKAPRVSGLTGGSRLAPEVARQGTSCVLSPARELPFLVQHEGPTDFTLFLRPMGQVRALALFVDFPDVPQSEGIVQRYEQLMPQTAQWYQESSYDLLSLDFNAAHKWYRMPRQSADYGFALEWPMAQRRPFVEDAIRSADSEVDFRGYQIVYIVTPRGTPVFRTTWFLLLPGRGIRADGIELRHAILVWGTGGRWSHLVHNTAHLFGLPDLYDRQLLFAGLPQRDASIYVGGWDVMGWNEIAAHFFAWHKAKLGWLGPSDLICMGTGEVEETLTPVAVSGGVKAIAVPTGPSTAYVAEVRQPIGHDSRLCDRGVLVYTVDATVASGAAPGPIRLAPAQKGTDPGQLAACGPFYDAPFDVGEGKLAVFEDPAVGLTVQVLERLGDAYRVRLAKQ